MKNEKRVGDEGSNGLTDKCDFSEVVSAVENTQFRADAQTARSARTNIGGL